MNSNWSRWLHSSINKYFTQYSNLVGFNLAIEGQSKKNENVQDWAELRWNGPIVRELTKGYWLIDIHINILASSILERNDSHQHKKLMGLIQAGFTNCISVFRYGVSDVDTQDQLGVLELDKQGITTAYFGQIDADVLIEQSSVDASYRMVLSTR